MTLSAETREKVERLVKEAVTVTLSRLEVLPADADAFDKLAAITGLSRAEVKWTAGRIQELMRSGLTAREASNQVRAEGKSRPWLQ